MFSYSANQRLEIEEDGKNKGLIKHSQSARLEFEEEITQINS
jgi:hypothetical protein